MMDIHYTATSIEIKKIYASSKERNTSLGKDTHIKSLIFSGQTTKRAGGGRRVKTLNH